MSSQQFCFSDVITRRFAQVLYRCLEEVKSTKGALYLSIQGKPDLYLVSHYGFPRLVPPPEFLAEDSQLVTWVRRERRSFIVNAAQPSSELAAFAQGAETPRFLITPINDKGNWVGILVQRDLLRGEPYDLARDETPTLAICEEIVETYRGFRLMLDPNALSDPAPAPAPGPAPAPAPGPAGQMPAKPVSTPTSDSLRPPSTQRFFPSDGEVLEGYPDVVIQDEQASLVVRSGRYATLALEDALGDTAELLSEPVDAGQELKPGMFPLSQRTFFWEAAALLSSLVPFSAVALWLDEPQEIRPVLAYSPRPLSQELKQQILAHAMYHIPKVVERDLQILIKSDEMDQELQGGLFQTYLPVVLTEEGGGQDLLLLFRNEELAFSDLEQTYIQQMARLLGFYFQESRLHENYHRAFLSVAHRILTSMEGGAPKLRTHSLNTAILARNLALHMELSSSEVEAVSIAGILHDVGSFMLDPGLLAKSPLTARELAKIQTHPVLAAIFLKDFRFPFDVLRIIRHHHERWDGMGYPDGLRGEEIPIESRLLHLVESFEVMSSGSQFKAAMPRDAILNELRHEAGQQFDPLLVAGFLEFLTANVSMNL